MDEVEFSFSSKLWVYSGKGAWHFVSLPLDVGQQIKFYCSSAKGFQPIKLQAQIGNTCWNTAIFPDSKSGSYALAIKAAVRQAEKLAVGDLVAVHIVLQPMG